MWNKIVNSIYTVAKESIQQSLEETGSPAGKRFEYHSHSMRTPQ